MVDENTPLLQKDSLPLHERDNEHSRGLRKSDWLLIGMISCSGFLNVFTAQSTILMLPSIAATYNVPTHRQHLITSIYNISSGCLILLWARLADIYGRGLVFVLGSAAFTVASVALPFSPNEIVFYIFRALQGISIAASVPSAIGILAATFPTGKRRNYAFVIYNSTSSLGAVIGNIAGGIIGGFLSWYWVFWSAAILGGIVTVLALLSIPLQQDRNKSDCKVPEKRASVDWLGGFLVTASLVTFLITLSDSDGWEGYRNIAQLIVALGFGISFISWQQRIKDDVDRPPLIKLSLFRNRGLRAALLTYACFVASFNTFLIYASLFFQQYLGLSILQTTWRFIPSGLSCCLISFVIAPALSSVQGFYLLVIAILANMASSLLFAIPLPSTTSYWAYGFPAMSLTMSIEVLAPVLALYVVKCLSQGDQALGGGLVQTANNLGKSVGLAIAGLVQGTVEVAARPRGTGEDGSLWALADKRVGDERLLVELRVVQGVNVGISLLALAVTVKCLRQLGKC